MSLIKYINSDKNTLNLDNKLTNFNKNNLKPFFKKLQNNTNNNCTMLPKIIQKKIKVNNNENLNNIKELKNVLNLISQKNIIKSNESSNINIFYLANQFNLKKEKFSNISELKEKYYKNLIMTIKNYNKRRKENLSLLKKLIIN